MTRYGIKDTSLGPWMKWEITNRAERAIKFIESYCHLFQGYGAGELIVLAQYQKDWLYEVFADGVKAAILSIPRGNGKSTFLGALATWALFDPVLAWGDPKIYLIAYTLSQTAETYGAALRFIELEDELARRSVVHYGRGTEKVIIKNELFNGEMMPIASEHSGLQGKNPTLGIIDEAGEQEYEVWTDLRMGAQKRGNCLIIAIGTPGDENTVLGKLHEQYLKDDLSSGMRYLEYSAPANCDVKDESLWLKANPLLLEGKMDITALRDNLKEPEATFRKFHLGQWTTDTKCWLGMDGKAIWDRLRGPYDFVEHAATWAGLDVGLSNDTSALVWIQKREDGRYHAKTKIWYPELSNDGQVNTQDIEDFIINLKRKYDLRAVAFDPAYFQREAMRLETARVPLIEVPQQQQRRMAEYIARLYNAIITGELSHDGDEAFRTQILNAERRSFSGELYTLQKLDKKQTNKIDSTIALALALSEAQLAPPERTRLIGGWLTTKKEGIDSALQRPGEAQDIR